MRKKKKEKVGELIRLNRMLRGMSQMALAEKIGISYQQLQKYEYGTSDISVSRLWQIAETLKVPVNSFLGSDTLFKKALNEKEIKLLTKFRKLKNENVKDIILSIMDDALATSGGS